jgi:L-cysteine desulfidase
MQIGEQDIENMPIISILYDYRVRKKPILENDIFEKTHFHSIQNVSQTRIYFGRTKLLMDPKHICLNIMGTHDNILQVNR